MAKQQPQNNDISAPQDMDELQKKLDEFLVDLAAKVELLQKSSLKLTLQDARAHEGVVLFLDVCVTSGVFPICTCFGLPTILE